jgi:hypothetical protein
LQFGIFLTWTQANAFASHLNAGLDLTPHEVRRIVTSSFLARSIVLNAALSPKTLFWHFAPVLSMAEEIQVRFVLAQLDLAITFCRLACARQDERPSQRLVRNAYNTLNGVLLIASKLEPSHPSFKSISGKCRVLGKALKNVPAALAFELS